MRKDKARTCDICGSTSTIAGCLGVCKDCLIDDEDARRRAELAHYNSRIRSHLPTRPPREGKACGQCVNDCHIPEGGVGYCGVRWNIDDEIVGLGGYEAIVSAHREPLPTNCVADWICPGGNGCGYPMYSHSPGTERGFYNLSVFYGACTFDCLFCQNWHFKDMTSALRPRMSPEAVEEMIDHSTSCVCFFGGDPTSFIQHSISVAEIARGRENGIRRMCWETNGSMKSRWARKLGDIAMESGGIVKVDAKAFDNRLHRALCGSSNSQTLRNIEILGKMAAGRREVPLLVVSTPMIPGYVDEEEVPKIAGFLAEIDPDTPYSLLAFHPSHAMSDLPVTTRKEAEACVKAAREAGLEEVHIGNEWMLR